MKSKALLDKVADVTTSYPVPIGGIEFTDGFERVICDLLAELVEKPVLTERESNDSFNDSEWTAIYC